MVSANRVAWIWQVVTLTQREVRRRVVPYAPTLRERQLFRLADG